MRSRFVVLALALILAVAMATDAFARAGRGGSFGSRGSRTFDRPIERSVTPAPSTVQPGSQSPMYRRDAVGTQQPGAAMQRNTGGFFQRNPMMGGLLAGFVGAGLFGLLFNSSAFAAAGDAAPFASFLGMALQLALIGGLVWMVMRMLRRRSSPSQSAMSSFGGQARMAAGNEARVEKAFEPSPADKDAFTAIIMRVQESWSAGDLMRLREVATPEVVAFLSEDLARDASQGVRNVVEDVELLAGDVVESWRDGDLEFVTARIRFTARDYTIASDGRVVEGNPDEPAEATEIWTFVRAPGGRWLVSAVEQAN